MSTDKVDAPVPSTVAGVVTKLLAEVDETVTVGQALCEIEAGDAPAAAPADDASSNGAAESEETAEAEDRLGESVDVTLPEMGDSVVEGTLLEWLVKVGDQVSEGDDLAEMSTDKIDAALPAPVSGTVTELLAEPDDTVAVGAVLCRIQAGAGAPKGKVSPAAEVKEAKPAAAAPATQHAVGQRRLERHPGRYPVRRRPGRGHLQAHRHGPTRARDQGRRPERGGRRRLRRARQARDASRARPRGRRDNHHPRPRRHAGPVHGPEPVHPHRNQLPHPVGRRTGRPPCPAQGRRQEAVVHPPDRLGNRPGRRRRHARHGQLVHRGGRQAAPRDPGRGQPGPGGGRRAQGRHPHADRAGHQERVRP